MDDRRVTRWARATAVVAACVAVLAGCSIAPADGPGGFHLAQIGGGLPTRDRAIRTVRVTAPPANGYEWTVRSVDPGSRDLRLLYTDGACTSADRLAVQEAATTVTIGITASKTFDGICSDVGIPRSTTVTLRHPLGARALMESGSGANDGLPSVATPGSLPAPTCGPDEFSDTPAGMADVGARMAPTTASTVFVCRTWWPKGIAHEESTTLSGRAAVAALVAGVDSGSRSLRAGPVPMPGCSKNAAGSWYSVYFEGPGMQVQVKADEIWCGTITNGAVSGTMTPALEKRLDALFAR